jgi:hypothetical protein
MYFPLLDFPFLLSRSQHFFDPTSEVHQVGTMLHRGKGAKNSQKSNESALGRKRKIMRNIFISQV